MIPLTPHNFHHETDSWKKEKAFFVDVDRKLHGTSERFQNTAWLYLSRALHFAKNAGTVNEEENTGLAAIAIRSRKAVREKTKDGGFMGWLRGIKAKGLPANHDPKSIKKVEDFLEEVGAIKIKRNGHGKVSEAYINVRLCALLLEYLHPDFEWLQEHTGGLFNWLQGFCSKILGRPFNRRDPEGDIYDGDYMESDLEVLRAEYPTKVFSWSRLPEAIAEVFRKYCRPVVERGWEYICVYWDVDIGDPPLEELFA